MISTILPLFPVKTSAISLSRRALICASSAVRGYCSLISLGMGSLRLKIIFCMMVSSLYFFLLMRYDR